MATNEPDVFNSLPHHLVTDHILIRFPVKTLYQFKSVSKLWNHTISSPKFAESHFAYHNALNPSSTSVFFQHGETLDYEAYNDEHPLIKGMNCEAGSYRDPGGSVSLGEALSAHLNGARAFPFGSSRGLVALLSQPGQICVCNPTLQHYRMIPTPPSPFDPLDVLCGFGYVSSLDDFKLVLGSRGRSKESYKRAVYVFSLRSNTWRTIKEEDDQFRTMADSDADCNGILTNEHLHWGTYDRIVAFDFVHEVFDQVPIPKALSSRVPYSSRSSKWSGLSRAGGCLCLCIFWKEYSVEIWKLKEYKRADSWEKLYDIYLWPSDIVEFPCNEFFGFTKTGELLVQHRHKDLPFSFYNGGSEGYVLINPYQNAYQFNFLDSFNGKIGPIVSYVETLISPLAFLPM